MTYHIYALTNDRAQLCAKRASVSCAATADMIAAAWEAEGYKVNRDQEG